MDRLGLTARFEWHREAERQERVANEQRRTVNAARWTPHPEAEDWSEVRNALEDDPR
jgi:hypothetical protein